MPFLRNLIRDIGHVFYKYHAPTELVAEFEHSFLKRSIKKYLSKIKPANYYGLYFENYVLFSYNLAQ